MFRNSNYFSNVSSSVDLLGYRSSSAGFILDSPVSLPVFNLMSLDIVQASGNSVGLVNPTVIHDSELANKVASDFVASSSAFDSSNNNSND